MVEQAQAENELKKQAALAEKEQKEEADKAMDLAVDEPE